MIRFLQTPGPLQKALLIGFLAIICIMMVVTLIPGGILSELGITSREGRIAKVGAQDVTIQDVNVLANQIGRQQFPRGVPPQLRPYLLQQAAQSLMLQDLLLNEANRMSLHTSDDELRQELQHGPLAPRLFPDGNFIGTEQYRSLVQENFGLSVDQFEQIVKRQLSIGKLRSVIEGPATVSPAEVMAQFRRDNTKVKFEYAVLSVDELAKQVKPTDPELRAYYEKAKPQFVNSIPEKRSAAYAVIDAAKLPNPPQVSQEDLQSYYKAHQDEFRVPESVTVRHILIKTPPGADGKIDPKAAAEARAKAEDILKQLKAGADFGALAKKYSQDTASASKGGLLGPITRGRTVPEFEKAAFATPKGQTSGVIQTDYGFHILRVDDKTDARLKSLDEAKPQIEPVLARQKAQSAAEALSRTLEAEARAGGLQKAAKAHNLQVVSSGYFTRGETLPGIGNARAFMDTVFSAKPMAPPTAVATAQGFAVVQVTDVKPAATPDYEQVKAKVEQQFRMERAQALLAQKTQELADRAHAAHNLRAAAKELGATLRTSDLVAPGGQVPEIGQLAGPAAEIFNLKPGEISGPVNTARGGAVMMLLEKQEPSTADFDNQKEQLREQLLKAKQSELFELYVAHLGETAEKSGEVKKFPKEWDRMLSTVRE